MKMKLCIATNFLKITEKGILKLFVKALKVYLITKVVSGDALQHATFINLLYWLHVDIYLNAVVNVHFSTQCQDWQEFSSNM